jgi:hypothetical protein
MRMSNFGAIVLPFRVKCKHEVVLASEAPSGFLRRCVIDVTHGKFRYIRQTQTARNRPHPVRPALLMTHLVEAIEQRRETNNAVIS